MPRGVSKNRDPIITYNNKVKRITKWYKRLIKIREENSVPKINPNTNLPAKRKELKPLNYYLDKIKKQIGER